MPEPIRYSVDLARHRQHLVEVAIEITDVPEGTRLVLPVWTPGSYFVRDYARHVQQISVRDLDGRESPLEQDTRTSWRLPAVESEVTVTLELYANELTVRTNHVDDHHALLVGAATFPFVEGATERRHEVIVHAPNGWHVWSLLPTAGDSDGATFTAVDYDHLADSAFEAGAHEERSYEVSGVPHRFVWAGHAGWPDLDRVIDDATAIGEESVRLFAGDLPVDEYTFLCTAWDRGGGGLEHRDGAVLTAPAHGFRDGDGYARFQSLLAHEYFHLWNVKRLVPLALLDLDYEQPVHSPSLWVAEGWTSYYDELLPLRAGVWDTDHYLKEAGKHVQRVLERPGARLQSVRQSSYEAWTKFYVRDENTPNVGVSYYEHGGVLAWCLDLLLRRERPDGDGLDDVVRLLWERFGRHDAADSSAPGYTEEDVEAATTEVAATDLGGFFSAHVDGREPPPILDLLEVVGLRWTPKESDDPVPPDLGVECAEDDDGYTFTSVLRGRPAWQAGLTGGDRLVALERTRVGRGDLPKALRAFAAGDTVELTVFRGPRLVHTDVTLGDPRPEQRLEAVEDPTPAQRAAFRRWSGRDLPTDD